MNAEDLYRREDLMTPEELEEWHFEPSSAEVETLSPLLRQWILLEITQKSHNHLGLGVTHRRSWRAKLDQ
jgi:hypothetical protein